MCTQPSLILLDHEDCHNLAEEQDEDLRNDLDADAAAVWIRKTVQILVEICSQMKRKWQDLFVN